LLFVIVFAAVVYIFKPKTGFQLCQFISHTKAGEGSGYIYRLMQFLCRITNQYHFGTKLLINIQ